MKKSNSKTPERTIGLDLGDKWTHWRDVHEYSPQLAFRRGPGAAHCPLPPLVAACRAAALRWRLR